MKKRLKVFVFFSHQNEETHYNKIKRSCDRVRVNLYKIEVDTTGLDDVDSHFLSQIVNRHITKQEDVCSLSLEYDKVWLLGLKEFMWRIGYEIELTEVSHQDGIKHHNEFTQNDPFGWTDFRCGYPRYEHRE